MEKLESSNDLERNLTFDPPVYRQRYEAVFEILIRDKDIKKVVDFGCAELRLFAFLKQLYSLEEIVEVDIDANLLENNSFRIDPILNDYLDRRTLPFKVKLLSGSISNPDQILIDTDAVIAIEIIEHLFPDTLDALPYNIFNYIKPKIAIFTTPNADFNVLFRDFKVFRHHDHKFEWSREQFESWAQNVTIRYPNYSVTFDGVGKGPDNTQHLGCCSQMAVFTRSSELKFANEQSDKSFGICTYFSHTIELLKSLNKTESDFNEQKYNLVKIVEYPVALDDRTLEQKIVDELIYKINTKSVIYGMHYIEDEDKFEIPIEQLFLNQKYSCTFDEGIKLLRNAGYVIEQCSVCDEMMPCVVVERKYPAPSSESSQITDEEISQDQDWFEGPLDSSETEKWDFENENWNTN